MNIFIWTQNPSRHENDILIENGQLLSPLDLERTSMVKNMHTIQCEGKSLFNENNRVLVFKKENDYLIHFRTSKNDEFNRKLWASILVDYNESDLSISDGALGELIQKSMVTASISSEFSLIETAISKIELDISASKSNNVSVKSIVLLVLFLLLIYIIGTIILK